jgi:hypothetical protein
MEGTLFCAPGEVFGTSGDGSTAIGISGISICGRTLALAPGVAVGLALGAGVSVEAGVSVADGSGGSWAERTRRGASSR